MSSVFLERTTSGKKTESITETWARLFTVIVYLLSGLCLKALIRHSNSKHERLINDSSRVHNFSDYLIFDQYLVLGERIFPARVAHVHASMTLLNSADNQSAAVISSTDVENLALLSVTAWKRVSRYISTARRHPLAVRPDQNLVRLFLGFDTVKRHHGNFSRRIYFARQQVPQMHSPSYVEDWKIAVTTSKNSRRWNSHAGLGVGPFI